MTTSDYLEQLQQDKSDLVDNLTTKGITGLTGDETFTELVPEVLNIPSGGSSDIYRATSLAGLPQSANEGDLGVVYINTATPPTAETEFSVFTVPLSYTFSTAITGTNSLSFRPKNGNSYPRITVSLKASGNSTVTVQLTSSIASRTTYTYTTSDALTYTLSSSSPTPTNTDLGTTMYCYSTTFNENASKFILIPEKDFACYTYSNNSWGYTDIDANATSDDMFAPKKAYTNNGLVVGSYDKGSIRENLIKASTTEPEEVSGVWLKTSSDTTFNKSTTNISYTNADLDTVGVMQMNNTTLQNNNRANGVNYNQYRFYVTTNLFSATMTILYFNVLTSYEGTLVSGLQCGGTGRISMAIVSNYLFVSSRDGRLFRFDLTNITDNMSYTTFSLPTVYGYVFPNANNTILYCLQHTSPFSFYKSTDNGNTWTTLSSTISSTPFASIGWIDVYWFDNTHFSVKYSINGIVYKIENDTLSQNMTFTLRNVFTNVNNHHISCYNYGLAFDYIFNSDYTTVSVVPYMRLKTSLVNTLVYNNTAYCIENNTGHLWSIDMDALVKDGTISTSDSKFDLLMQTDVENGAKIETAENQYIYISNVRWYKVPTTSGQPNEDVVTQIYIPNSDSSAWVLYKDYTQNV